jgi:galactoside O-acetyltransferase
LAERLEFAPVRLCYGADIGARSVVLPGVTVGERSVVGAGSVVSRDVPEGSVFAGVPARLLRQRRMPEAAEDS